MKNVDEVVYFASLLLCISLGRRYRAIGNVKCKRNCGTAVGVLLVACFVCWRTVIHCMVMVGLNIVIIKFSNRRRIHQLSFIFTWAYLTYLHIYVIQSLYSKWILQTVALRVVGLAFEVNRLQRLNRFEVPYTPSTATLFRESEVKMRWGFEAPEVISIEPTVGDMMSYAFYFIGIHKGPYFRWSVFDDHFKSNPDMNCCRAATVQKLKAAALCIVGYIALQSQCTTDIYRDENFYKLRSTDYRFLTSLPLLVQFFLQHQVVTLLSSCVCTETGFGVYPTGSFGSRRHSLVSSRPPSATFEMLSVGSMRLEAGIERESNVAIFKCFDYEKLIIGPRMRHTLRSWDIPTQFWFWAYTNRCLGQCSKEIRSAFSFIAWTVWSGPSLQKAIMSATLWVHVHLETEYGDLFNTSAYSVKVPWDIGYSIMRLFCLIYLTPCFVLDDSRVVLRYYNSIYWIYHWVLFALLVAAVVICKARSIIM